MIEKLQEVENRFEEVNELVCNPDIVCDQEKYTKLMRELKHLTPVVEKFREYKKAKANEEESRAMLDEGGMDADFAQMVKEEYEQSREDMERIEEELKVLLLPRDPNDDKNVIIEIRGGAGGEESALFAGVLFRMYSMYAESKGFKTEILNANETGLGGYKEISFSVEGDGAYSRFKFESGVHRVQRVPETESQGRIHTSTTTVAVLPEAEDVDFEINPKDLQIDTFSILTRPRLPFVLPIFRREQLLNVRTKEASIKTRKRRLRFCVPVFMTLKKLSTMLRLQARERRRSAQVIEARE